MMTAAEQTTAGMIHITSGWIILRNGARFEEQLYLTERAAKTMAGAFRVPPIAPAKRIWTIPRRKRDWNIGEAK